MKTVILFVLLLICTSIVYGQMPSDEFFNGLDLLNRDQVKSKKAFQVALSKDSLFHGTYHFLGVIYLNENKLDSAVDCFRKSILLNKENINHTREMTYSRLIRVYMYQHDFSNSYSTAWDAYSTYPESKLLERNLKDVCLWSFYTKHNGLNLSYLTPNIKDEYIVRSVPEEYLIFRTVKSNDESLNLNSQSCISKNGSMYDILSCSIGEKKGSIDLNFKLDWDFNKEIGGRVTNTKSVYSNQDNPIYERIGALLVSNSKLDIGKEIKNIIK